MNAYLLSCALSVRTLPDAPFPIAQGFSFANYDCGYMILRPRMKRYCSSAAQQFIIWMCGYHQYFLIAHLSTSFLPKVGRLTDAHAEFSRHHLLTPEV